MSEACSDFELLAADIRRQPSLLEERIPYLRQAAGEMCAGMRRPSRVYLVACGDGLSAALAASNAWERLLDCPVEAVPAMTFSRYRAQNAGPGSLAVVISQSGQVVRVIEALASALRRGLETLVVTNKPESPLRSLTPEGRIFELGFERLGFTPGASAYTYTLAALYELAAAFSPNPEAKRELRRQIDRLPQALGGAVEAVWGLAGEFAGRLEKGSTVFILGSGPAYGTAHYTMRKLFEISQVKSTLLETEEYAHDAYYALDVHTPVLLYTPPDAGLRRGVEIAGYAAEIGCPLAVVSGPEQRGLFSRKGLTYIGLPGDGAVEASLTYPVAAQALACLAGKRLGGAFYACDDPARYLSGDAQIYESARMDLEDG